MASILPTEPFLQACLLFNLLTEALSGNIPADRYDFILFYFLTSAQ